MADFEQREGIVRGQPGSERSAMCFGDYFPNPQEVGVGPAAHAQFSHGQAMLAEILGTALLVFFVFALTDPRNSNRPHGTLAAIFIGLTVTCIVAVQAPLTMAGLNPARDFGPRLFAWLAGWGSIAIPGPRSGFFTVYVLSPIIGGLLGAAVYQYALRPGLPAPTEEIITKASARTATDVVPAPVDRPAASARAADSASSQPASAVPRPPDHSGVPG
jgi:glycerol uptake facilitator protein